MANLYGYVRVSTSEQSVSGLGLEDQRRRIAEEAERRGWNITWVEDAGYSAKDLNRPGIEQILHHLAQKSNGLDDTAGGKMEGLVVAKLDRLSRSIIDFANLMALAQKQGWMLVSLDLGVDTSTAQGQLLANVMASFAQFERLLIAERTSAALQALKNRGVRLGRPVAVSPAVRASVGAWRSAGASLAAIAQHLNDSNVPTAQGGARWYASTVRSVLRSLELDEEATQLATLKDEWNELVS